MAKKQAYVVLVGLKPGVYTNWLDVTQNVVGVPHAQYKGFTYWDDASKYYERAYSKGATRAVKKPPKDEEDPRASSREQHQGRRSGGSERPPRRRQHSSPAGGGAQAPTSASRGTSAGKAARDAQIAAALADARKNRIGPSASSPSVMSSSERSKPSRHAALARSATEPAYHNHIQVQDPQAASTPRRPARRARERASPEPQQRPRTLETSKGSSGSIGPISDIPTDETQLKNRFTNSPGRSTPRYAQSLSYASESPSLLSSDLRTHLSSPSSFGTRYFPEDWLARLERRRESGDRGLPGEDRGSVLSTSVSEYATAPNTPEMESVVLEDDVEDMHIVASPSASACSRVGWSEPSSASSSAKAKARPKTWSSAIPPRATATEVISSPSATSTPRRTSSTPDSVNDRYFSPSIASVPPSSPLPSEPKNKPGKRVTRSLSEAEVQTDAPPQVRRRKNPEAGVQAAPPSAPKRQLLDNEVQTTPAASPLRASIAIGDIPVRPLPGGPQCRCEHPEYACIHCGHQRPRSERRSARSTAGHSRSSRAPPSSTSTSTTTVSPAASEISSLALSPALSAAPASAVPGSVSTRSTRSSRSHIGGHTPLMGPSERAHTRSLTARIEASLGTMSFSEAAQGVTAAEAVVHDVGFDPRSPIQRGTRVPAGTSGSAVRPSPAVVPVPMGSLGLLFPS